VQLPACGRILLGLDIGRSDDLCPLRGLVGNELAELVRGHWYRIAAKVGEMLDHLRISEARIGFLVELYDDFGGDTFRRTDAEPRARFYPGTNSVMVGVSGSATTRVVLVTAKARSLPAFTYPMTVGIGANTSCT
jgi:hypothetical protein